MAEISFQFQGVRNEQLLLTLLVVIGLTLAGYGSWLLWRRRWRAGGVCVGIVAGVGAAGAMLRSAGVTGGGPWMALLALEIVLTVGAFYLAVYAYLGKARLATLMILRSLGIGALLVILFKPALSFTVAGGDDRPYLPILVDRSGSMGTADQANIPDRYVQAVQALALHRGRLGEHFRLVWHHFGESLNVAESLDELGELKPAGPGTGKTDLALAIRSAAADYDPASLAGVLVLSDGLHNASDADSAVKAAAEAAAPVYTVAVGSTNEALAGRRNIELLSAECPFEAVKDNVTTITCRVKLTGLATVPVQLRLLEEGSDRPLDTARLWTDKNTDTVTAELKWTPRDRLTPAKGPDVRKLRVSVAPNPAEAVTEDNDVQLHVLVSEPRIRVLYVEGSMRPEFKFLRRLLDSDPNVRFMALVRITAKRFLAQGGIAGRQLRTLPARDEDFALFDVIILGDLDRTFWTNDQLARLRRFVNDGGGLLMLGGHNSFGPGGYGGTDVEQILPVVVGSRSQPQETTPLLPQLTAAGRRHPIFEGLTGYFPGPAGQGPEAGLARLPELLGCVTVVRSKPGARVLAVHPTRGNENGPLVVLAVQPFGAGRAAAFTPDTTWQWYLPLRAMGAESPYERFWGQFIRYLAGADAKSRRSGASLVLRTDRRYTRVGRAVRILARVLDEKAQTPKTAVVSCRIEPTGQTGAAETVPMSYRTRSGLFEADFRPRREGAFDVKVLATDGQGAMLGRDELRLIAAPYSAEMERLARNDDLLRRMSQASDGRFTQLAGLPELVDQIIDRDLARTGPAPEATIHKLYNFVALFLAFAAFITGEWLLRRNWQLH